MEVELKDFAAFEERIKGDQEQIERMRRERDGEYISGLIFRGQGSAKWGLKTTLVDEI
jgi:hypothetical protein